ncbi:MAG: AMP-binding protein, partial [Flavobacteriaceae bacterium]
MKDLAYRTAESYLAAKAKALENPEAFWADVAENFDWHTPWNKVLEYDFHKPEVKWFLGGKLNITESCLDRHVKTQPEQTALIFEPNDPNESAQHISYKALHSKVCQAANMLKANGAKKGDRICLYMPMVPELAIAVLACARIGAIHSVVFAGFSATALAARINDAECS